MISMGPIIIDLNEKVQRKYIVNKGKESNVTCMFKYLMKLYRCNLLCDNLIICQKSLINNIVVGQLINYLTKKSIPS